jgi:hypothetical protein
MTEAKTSLKRTLIGKVVSDKRCQNRNGVGGASREARSVRQDCCQIKQVPRT